MTPHAPTAAPALLLEVAPDLTFLLEGFPPALRQRVERFLYRFTGRGLTPSKPPLRLVRAPAPARPSGPSLVAGPVEVRRAGGVTFFDVAGLRGWCDPESSRAGVELGDPPDDALEAFTRLALVAILFELAEGRGWLGLHAAAVAIGERGVLLPGASGTGKTTILQGAHRAGLGVLSDDLVWLRETGAGFRIHAFPRGGAAGEPAAGGPVPEPTTDDVAVGAIVCPGIAARPRSRLRKLSVSEVVEVVFSQSGVLSLDAAGERFRRLVRLARSAPGYRLEAGSVRDDVAALLRAGL